MTLTLTQDLDSSEIFFSPPEEMTLRSAVVSLGDLMKEPRFLEAVISPLLERERAKDWYVAFSYGLPDGASLQIFFWPPGTATRVHDHSSWGAFRCVAGSILEARYARHDDGSEPERARLRKVWRRLWSDEDGVSTVLPYAGGIHRLCNPGGETAISMHIYGPRIGEIDGRDYDPSRDYVCDRRAA